MRFENDPQMCVKTIFPIYLINLKRTKTSLKTKSCNLIDTKASDSRQSVLRKNFSCRLEENDLL